MHTDFSDFMAARAEKQNNQIEGDVMTELEQEFIATNTRPQFEATIRELEPDHCGIQ